ncbi:MAG TPA: hypothetical protein VJN94_16520, partial [Candidatus Binataceae bacterium]|nr:hypothetical protein [Candidatus Binataceae bacterium]
RSSLSAHRRMRGRLIGVVKPRLKPSNPRGIALVVIGLAFAIAGCGSDSNNQSVAPPPPKPVLRGSCAPSSSLGVLVHGKDVTSYVPKGNWGSSTTGVSVVQVEPTAAAAPAAVPTVIATASAVNSCGSDAKNGQTVCVANNTDVYLIKGDSLTQTLHSSGTTTVHFSGGTCTNCGVAIDSVNNKALITLGTAGGPGFQYLDLNKTPKFESAFASASQKVSEDPLVDPIRKLILSPNENGKYELIKNSSTKPAFFENPSDSDAEYDSAGEDCATGIALATDEFTSNLFLANLTQATFTPGTPGSWTAPSQLQNVPDFGPLSFGTNGMAVAQNTHTGVVVGEFGGNTFGAILLPSSAGTGVPALSDWVVCSIPSDPSSAPWEGGNDPHTVTAYQSPNSNDAIALMANGDGNPPTFLAVVDLTKMLDTTIVPRTAGTHTCTSGTNLQTLGVLTFVAVPQ